MGYVPVSVDLGLIRIDQKDDRWVIISMRVLCYANAIIEDDEIRVELPSAPLDMEYDNNGIV